MMPHVRWAPRPTGVSARLRALSVIDANTVWVAGASGAVLRTEDGGRKWRHVSPPHAEALHFRSVVAFDAHSAVVLSFGAGAAARLLSTQDGGASWHETFRNEDKGLFYNCLDFGDDRTGLALADPLDGRFVTLGSGDGGQRWAIQSPRRMPEALPGETAFAASGTCFVADGDDYWFTTGGADRARVFRSRDRGHTWGVADTPVPAKPDAGLFALATRDSRHALAVGGEYHDQTRPGRMVAVTTDAGRTWSTPRGLLPGFRSGVTWTGEAYLAVGPNGTDLSPDDGETWLPVGTTGFDTVHTAADGTCWAAGDSGRVAVLTAGRVSKLGAGCDAE